MSHNSDGTLISSAVAAASPVASVVGQTGTVTGAHIVADAAVATALATKASIVAPSLIQTTSNVAVVAMRNRYNAAMANLTIAAPTVGATGTTYTVVKTDSTTHTVTVAGQTLKSQGDEVTFVSDGSVWVSQGVKMTRGSAEMSFAPIGKVSIRNNLLAELGGSIASYGTGGPVDADAGHYPGHLAVICALSMGRIQWGGNYSAGGARIADVLASQLPSLLAQSIRPGACLVEIGANDLAANAGVGWSLSTMATSYDQILYSLTAAGIVPVLWMVTPNGANTTVRANIAIWNTYLARCAANRTPNR